MISVFLFDKSGHNLLGGLYLTHELGDLLRKRFFGITDPTWTLGTNDSLFFLRSCQKLSKYEFMTNLDALALEIQFFN
jgi:hypothetical protein